MKKKLLAVLAILTLSCTASGCAFMGNSLSNSENNNPSHEDEIPDIGDKWEEGWGDSSDNSSSGSGDNSGGNSGEGSGGNSGEDSGEGSGGNSGEDSGEGSGGNSGDNSGDAGKHTYTDFTEEEKELFRTYIGDVIPFAPNNEYYVEGYWGDTDYEYGMCFYTFGNTQAEFNAYREAYLANGYVFFESYEDEDYGDTWYCYEKDDIYVELSFYLSDGENVIDVYVTSSLSKDWDDDWGDDWGDQGGSGGGSGSGSEDVELITNAGKGLPTSANGVYNVDFTKAKYVKNVTEQGYYLDGCPTLSTETANPAVLVIPIEFSDVTAQSKGYTLDKLEKAFLGASGTTDYYSVKEYFSIASYGQLDLDITVLDSWFKPKNTSAYYAKQTMDFGGDQVAIGDQMIMDEALAYLESRMDLSKFDSDNNGIIDAVVMINTLDIDENTDFQWAYRYWNIYTDNSDNYYEYDKVSANDYLWASYQFMLEQYSDNGDTYYDKNALNTYTYIHEFSHVLGADDYYDTAYVGSPMGGYDMMDSMLGDHNPYTKFNYGWITTSRLIVAEDSVTVTLKDFSKSGDTVIIANNWDEELGVYQEYYVLVYYKNTGLNSGDGGYFNEEGIIVYHVNASLFKEVYDGEAYYDVYNTNTDESDRNGYGTKDNLIEIVGRSNSDYVYGAGDSLSSSLKDDQGNTVAYTFTVLSIGENEAEIRFVKNK